ncbi:DUF4845 domain-containing protein [Thiohalomonas denitrificans]|uniref:DUF4845 domain-containing protein n=1 Tax=Thiohalomonas denitrificans TaxID=415747 RepID=UPI0026F06D62|nr:DUF4845 domain-containing protein [Thiohalomonas denitrificans]
MPFSTKQHTRQQGITLISWIVILGVIAFLTMMVLKLFPIYIEHMAVNSSLESLASEGEPMGPTEIRSKLVKRFNINDVKSVNRKNITIERGKGVYQVGIVYEVRTPFISNIDFVVSFDDHAEVRAP